MSNACCEKKRIWNILCLALLIFLVVTVSACGTKYIPSKQVLDLQHSLNIEQAVSLLNKNIEIAPGIGGLDLLSTVRATKNGFEFNNVRKKGTLLKTTSTGSFTTRHYEVKREDVAVPYSDIPQILGPLRDIDSTCNDEKALFQINRKSAPYAVWNLLCVDNNDDFFASILKLIPHATIVTY